MYCNSFPEWYGLLKGIILNGKCAIIDKKTDGMVSLVYRHITIYRFIMNLLYGGKYKKRFTPVMDLIKTFDAGSQILELCFADTFIARYCREEGYEWKGIDINRHFVEKAERDGFNAYLADLSALDSLPRADVCVMVGSLYHFHASLHSLIAKMLLSADSIVVSEPIVNLSSRKDVIGFFAKRAAKAGKGHEQFRYNSDSLTKAVQEACNALGCEMVLVKRHGKDLIIKIVKNGKN
jgi:hypothetical protein